jgi:lysophospholipase L1-like esterase
MGNPGNPRIPVQPMPLRHRLVHLASALAAGRTATIVAIGSSSTAGEGDVTPYPQLLESTLRADYQNRVNVINQGHGGEEAPAELARFRTDVLDLNPDLVIWQVGTNAVWNGESLDRTIPSVWRGLDLLAELPTDVILMDLQYVPALLTADRAALAEQMVGLIAEAAATARTPVSVFRRFAMMRAWHELEQISFDQIVHASDSSRLHQSDWATRRLAAAVHQVIVQALQPSETVPPAPSA